MLVIGAGNSMRRDDGAGPAVVQALRERGIGGLLAIEHPGDGLALLDRWSGQRRVCLVDAAHSAAPAGAIHRFDAHRGPLPGGLLHHSSHLFGVAEAIELARLRGRLPAQLLVFGIEGRDFGFGMGLSAAVEAGVCQVVTQIVALLPDPQLSGS